jgi:hypothetical protein
MANPESPAPGGEAASSARALNLKLVPNSRDDPLGLLYTTKRIQYGKGHKYEGKKQRRSRLAPSYYLLHYQEQYTFLRSFQRKITLQNPAFWLSLATRTIESQENQLHNLAHQLGFKLWLLPFWGGRVNQYPSFFPAGLISSSPFDALSP